jgi:hypothetical protein
MLAIHRLPAEYQAHEQVSQLRPGLYHEVETELAHNVSNANLRNTSSPILMEMEKPIHEEFLGQLKSSGDLEESRQASKMYYG